jgi:purine-binding chemotaxis protein CheW
MRTVQAMQATQATTSLARGTLTEAESERTDTMLTVTFRIGQQQYGLPVSVVIEIVRLPALITLAGAPPAVIGLLNLRGYYVPVLDGSILVDETPHYDLNSQIIIAGLISEGSTILPMLGLRVDQVIDVRTLQRSQMTTLEKRLAAPFLKGVVHTDDGSVVLFDVESLLDMVPEEELSHEMQSKRAQQ